MGENASEATCLPTGNKWNYVFLMPLPIFSGLVNIFVWLAATLYRKKLLRHSYVYSSVASTLISNVFFLSLHLWDEVEGYRMSDITRPAMSDPNPTMELLWTLCTSSAISMVFVVCGNLTVLIYLMLESSYFQRKSHNPRPSSSGGKQNKHHLQSDLEKKRRRATVLVVLVWVVPVVLTVAAVVSWNCASVCSCPPGSIGELCPRSKDCSRTWPPMKNSYIAVNIGLWFVEVFVLAYVTYNGIRKYKNFNFRNSRNTFLSMDASPTLRNSFPPRSGEWSQSFTKENVKVTNEAQNISLEGDDDVFKPNPTNRSCISCKPLKLNPRLRLVCYLTIAFVLCTVMIPVCYILDVTIDDYPATEFRFASLVLVQLYTLLCPLLLVAYLSSLKSAVINMFSSICVCCK